MTNKRKKHTRALSEKTGMSYQAAMNLIRPPARIMRQAISRPCFQERSPLEFFVEDILADSAVPEYEVEGDSWILEEGKPVRRSPGDIPVPLSAVPLTEDDAWVLLAAAAASHSSDEMFDLIPWGTVRRGETTLIISEPEYVGRRARKGGREGLIVFNPGAIVTVKARGPEARLDSPGDSQLQSSAPVIRDPKAAATVLEDLRNATGVLRTVDPARLLMGVCSGDSTFWFSLSAVRSTPGFGEWWNALPKDRYNDSDALSEYLRGLRSDRWPLREKCDHREAVRRADLHRGVADRVVLNSVNEAGLHIGFSTFSCKPPPVPAEEWDFSAGEKSIHIEFAG